MAEAKKRLNITGILGMKDKGTTAPRPENPPKAAGPRPIEESEKPTAPAAPEKVEEPERPEEETVGQGDHVHRGTDAVVTFEDVGSVTKRAAKCYSLSVRAIKSLDLLAWKSGKNPSRFLDELLLGYINGHRAEVMAAYDTHRKMTGS